MAGLLESLGNLFGGPGYCPAPPANGSAENEDLLPPPLVAPGPDLPEIDLGPDAPPLAEGGAQTESDAQDRVRDEPCVAGCPNCAPRDMGHEIPNFYGAVLSGAQLGYAYQHFVCPWHAHNPAANIINEWHFSGIDFDGLHPAECLLFEAKHGYDDFLVQDDWSARGRPKLNPDTPWGRGILDRIEDRAEAKWGVCAPHYPEVRLKYVFSHSITRLYFSTRFRGLGLIHIETEHRPWSS